MNFTPVNLITFSALVISVKMRILKRGLSATRLKHCKFILNRSCFHDSCAYLDSNGNVRLCRFHPNPSGRLTSRVYGEVS